VVWLALAVPLGGGTAHAQDEAQAVSLIPDAVIADFNAAVSSTDMVQRVAGAKAAIASAIAHPADPSAATLAFEGGFLLCRSGACAQAQQAVDFLEGPAAGSWPAGEVQGLAALVGRSKKDTRASRKALGEAADAVLEGEPSLLSIRVLGEHVADLVDDGQFTRTEEVARRAAIHLDGVPSVDAIRWDFRIASVSSGFNATPSVEWLEKAMRLERELENMRIEGDHDREHWSEARFWRAHALRLTITSWLASSGKIKEIARREMEDRVNAEMPLVPTAAEEPDPATLPVCEMAWEREPAPVFPQGALKLGRVGAVIVRFTVDQGEVKDPEVLAAIPADQFGQAALASMKGLKFKRTGSEPDGTCKMRHDNVVIPFVFQLAYSESRSRTPGG
jgi:TonB family protein